MCRMSRRSVTVKDVPADEFIKAAAEFLKRQPKFDVPKYHDIVKTSVIKEFAPYDEDWFYIRCASLARRLYVRQGTGVGAFSKVYGAKKRRGTLPGHFCRASRGVIRSCLKQLQKVGVLEPMPEGKKGGRRVTKQGQQDCDRIAKEIFESKQN